MLATFAEAIQASLKEIGIATDIQTNDYDAHTNILKAGGFDLALNSYIMAPVADHSILRYYVENRSRL